MSQDPPREPAADEPTSDGGAPPREPGPAEPAGSAATALASSASSALTSDASSESSAATASSAPSAPSAPSASSAPPDAPVASSLLPSGSPPVSELLQPLPEPEPLPEHTPWVTIALAAANIVVWFVTLALGASVISPSPEWLFEHGGNLGAITLAGEEWRLFTSMFLHIGVLHIAMNMAGLIIGGRVIERLFGHLGFAAIYVISGLAGSLATALRPGVVSAGASGAIFGVLGALGAYYVIHRGRMDPRIARQASGLLVVVAYNVINGFVATGIDMYAHLGGLGAGFLCGFAMEIERGEPRLPRTLAVTAVGLVAVIVAAFAAPAPFDQGVAVAQQEQRTFLALFGAEEKLLGRWNELVEQVQADQVTDDQLADAIEQELLPPWRAALEAFDRSGAGGARRERLLDYLRTRQEAWEIMVGGLRAHDGDEVRRGQERMQAADALARKLVEPAE